MEKHTYRLVASDLDSTLITEELRLPQANIDAVRKARAKGCHFAICSGRSSASILQYEEQLGLMEQGCYGISFNGGIVYETPTRNKIRDIRLGNELALEISDELQDFGTNPWIYAGDMLYVVDDNKWVKEYVRRVRTTYTLVESFREIEDEVSKVIVVDSNERLLQLEARFADRLGGRYNGFFSADFLFEFTAKTATKGSALLYLAEYLGIPAAQTIGIGDNLNDVHMIQAAGLSVAVKNGRQELKDMADYVTERDCGEGAVAEVLEKFVL
ncbi:MAG: Cof-type HAD-IIB family hydrolase [Defluviitaleaceae bacterium]|nr:Cof-type HAD-IIB family hydrolase [Defluviitaleaceae bacterium]